MAVSQGIGLQFSSLAAMEKDGFTGMAGGRSVTPDTGTCISGGYSPAKDKKRHEPKWVVPSLRFAVGIHRLFFYRLTQ